MAGVILNGSTSGSVTLDPPAVAGSTVITLPSTSGTMITTASSGQSIPKAALPTGSVLQVVNATYATETTNSTTTFADTGLTASITPTSATSKILVLASVCGVGAYSTVGSGGKFQLVRNSTVICNMERVAGLSGSSNSYIGSVSTNYLDSPATTSSTTYKVQFANRVSGANVIICITDGAANATSTITLMEIAA